MNDNERFEMARNFIKGWYGAVSDNVFDPVLVEFVTHVIRETQRATNERTVRNRSTH